MAEGGDEGESGGVVGDPDPVDLAEVLDFGRECLGDEDGEAGACVGEVLFEFGDPSGTPVFGAFGFVEDLAATLAELVTNMLHEVGSIDPGANGDDLVEGESLGEEVLEVLFEDFALVLLGSLFGLTFGIFELAGHHFDGALFFRDTELEFFGGGFAGSLTGFGELGGDLLLDFEGKLFLLLAELFFFFEKGDFFFTGGAKLLVFGGESFAGGGELGGGFFGGRLFGSKEELFFFFG